MFDFLTQNCAEGSKLLLDTDQIIMLNHQNLQHRLLFLRFQQNYFDDLT